MNTKRLWLGTFPIFYWIADLTSVYSILLDKTTLGEDAGSCGSSKIGRKRMQT